MEINNIKVIKIFNLVNEKGTPLQLRLGMLEGNYPYLNDTGYRWSFIGSKIPMPVRNATWFNGFPEHIMLNWLDGKGWYLETEVNMLTGKANVYALPWDGGEVIIEKDEAEAETGTESEIDLPELRRHIERACVRLWQNGEKATAILLYRDAYPGTCLTDAKHTIKRIVENEAVI